MDSADGARPVVNALTVGTAFVTQYYGILYNMPDQLPRFYQEMSKIGRVGIDGVMRDFVTLQGISEELKKLSNGDFKSAVVTSYDTQESHSDGFLLVVNGCFTQNERLKRKFTQTFFLAPQENGFFVLNDILRFANEPEAIAEEVVSGNYSNRPTATNAPTGIKGSEQAACVSVKPVWKEVSKPLNNENAKESVLVPETVNVEVPESEITRKEVADNSAKKDDQDDGIEVVPKKSYASVLKVTKDKSGVSAGSALSPKQIPKDKEHQVSSAPLPKQIPKDKEHQVSPAPLPEEIPKDKEHQVSSAPLPEQILKDQGQQVSSDPSTMIEADAVSETVVDASENGHDHGCEAVAEGTSIYVKHLPSFATIEMLETEFKQFGAITSGGIQVIKQRDFYGFPYGVVEFEEADAALKAIEASPLTIGGQKAFVEEKRSTSRGHRGNGNGNGNGHGNRNVGVRGRGSYGGYGNNYRRGGGGGRYIQRRGNEYVANINTY